MSTTKKLPDLPSKLLRLAINDLALILKDPNYKLNMSTWHASLPFSTSSTLIGASLSDKKICEVCLAGAVMAKSLGAPILSSLEPNDFIVGDVERKLCAIDSFRTGHVKEAFENLDTDHDFEKGNLKAQYYIKNYGQENELIVEDMEYLISELEAAGW